MAIGVGGEVDEHPHLHIWAAIRSCLLSGDTGPPRLLTSLAGGASLEAVAALLAFEPQQWVASPHFLSEVGASPRLRASPTGGASS